MLGNVCTRFVEKSPMAGMVRGTLERVLGADRLEAWFARTAQKQSPRPLVFSTVSARLCQVVFRSKPSVRAAAQAHAETAGASLLAVSNQLHGVEPSTAAALVACVVGDALLKVCAGRR